MIQPDDKLKPLIDETEAIIVRSVGVGQTQGGSYLNIPVSSQGKLQIDLQPPYR